MNFSESVAYLYSLGNEVSAMKFGLENIRKLLAALGNPENDYLKVQVAGTNGKGSVCAFLDSICREAGIKAGVFTSPHLVSVTERVRIKGVDISEQEFARIGTHVRDVSEKLVEQGELENVPTYFEQVTAIALVAFAEGNVDLAILETGLGGRYDATTAANAEITVITRVDLDHQEHLGTTIEEIAAEKAAIILPDSRVVIGPQQAEAARVLFDRCAEMGITPVAIGGGNPPGREGALVGRRDREASAPSLPVGFPPLGLLGSHQVENAEIANGVVSILQEFYPVSDADIVNGLVAARHPGRLEYQGRFLFDGAHNIGGARALASFIQDVEKRPITLVFGAMRGKNIRGIAAILFPLANRVILTRPDNSRALGSQDLLALASEFVDSNRVFQTCDVKQALAVAAEQSGETDLILITGSLYLVGEVKRILKSQI